MTDLREAAQMALDALEDWDSLIQHQYNGKQEAMSDLTACAQSTPPIIEALRAALAQPEPVATGFIRTLVEVGDDGIENWKNEPFYTAQPQQKTKIHDCPRCHCHFMDSGEILSQSDGKSWRDNPQFPANVAAQPEQDPVAWQCQEHGDTEWFNCSKEAYDINPNRYIYRPLYTAPPQREWETLVESVRQMRDLQGMDGNWNWDPYMHGLFNGIEFALSLIEVREPKFKDTPEKWLCDQPKARIFLGGGNNG